MHKLINFLFMFSLCTTVYGQILIGGEDGHTIYSNIGNKIKYVGKQDCAGLSVRIEGYEEDLLMEDCSVKINYLTSDSSDLEIRNQAGEVIFKTTLLRHKNQGQAFALVGGKLLTEGTISKKDLKTFEGIRVKYPCPWLPLPKIYGFDIIVADDKGGGVKYEVSGHRLPNRYKKEILQIKNPTRIYIENINWVPISCFEMMNWIMLEIE